MTSVLLVLLGLVAYGIVGGHAGQPAAPLGVRAADPGVAPAGVYTSVGAVMRALWRRPVDPLAVISAGLLLLIATPVVGVAAAVPAFVRAGDRRYAAVAGVVLALLALGFALAGAG